MSKERSILFSGEMVRAILEGRKTQTRRLVTARGWDPNASPQVKMVGQAFFSSPDRAGGVDWLGVPSTYGRPGDRLWVRESFNWSSLDELAPGESYRECPARAGYRAPLCVYAADGVRAHPEHGKALWLPSVRMPRWASRITLEVTDVRVERLQDISEEDARAEGVAAVPGAMKTSFPNGAPLTHREAFARLWDSINAKRAPWASNPWVWVLSFRRLRP